MDPEDIISLFDSCWFTPQITQKPSTPNHKFQENPLKHHQITKLPSLLIRSKSDQLSSITSFNSDLSSPNSVLSRPNLQTILSGKEFTDQESNKLQKTEENRGAKNKGIKKSVRSKSLTELEFEELKGFMDMGFVFSEEDKDSRLVEIIPGLQRFGEKSMDQENGEKCSVSRPYLSERWEYLEEKKKNVLMNWRVPVENNEIDMKDSLKWWAHTVASAVR